MSRPAVSPSGEAGPDLADARAKLLRRSRGVEERAPGVGQEPDADDGGYRVEHQLVVVELGRERLQLGCRGTDPAREPVSRSHERTWSARACRRLHRRLPRGAPADLRDDVGVAFAGKPVDDLRMLHRRARTPSAARARPPTKSGHREPRAERSRDEGQREHERAEGEVVPFVPAQLTKRNAASSTARAYIDAPARASSAPAPPARRPASRSSRRLVRRRRPEGGGCGARP